MVREVLRYLIARAMAVQSQCQVATGTFSPRRTRSGTDISLVVGRGRVRTLCRIVGCTTVVLISVICPETASAWSQQLAPTPPGFFSNGDSGGLTDVSCSSGHACTAIGDADGVLLERWNGKDWLLQTPASSNGVSPPPIGGSYGLSGISCVSNTSCVAVGTASDPYQHAVFERWNGSAWSLQPAENQFFGGELWTVSCSSRVACMAAGDNNLDGSPLVARWDGRVWSRQTVHFEATGLSCFSRSMCAFIGQPLSSIGTTESCPVAGFWTRGRWLQNLALRCTNVAPTTRIAAVSCTSASACTSVGSVVYGWNGQRWTVERNVLRPGEFLRGLSCVSRATCVGVGLRRTGDTTRALVKRWNGSRWSTVYVSKLVGSQLNSVSCTSATACRAVGSYTYYFNGYNASGTPTRFGRSAPLVESNG
jgi:hypothetical protein